MTRASAGRWRIVIGLLRALPLLPLLGFSRDARAAASHVVAVVRPSDPGPMVTEVVTRVRGELVAAGFQVALIDHVPGADPGTEMRTVASRLHPLAIFGIFEQSDSGAADVWIADLLIGKTLVQRVEADPREGAPAKDGSSVQAVRAVELLRASLLELVVERSSLPPAAPPPPRDAPETSTRSLESGTPATKAGAFGFEAGAAVLHSFEGIGPTVAPILRLAYQPTPTVAFRLTASGFGTEPRLDAPEGQARVAQQFGLLEMTPIFFAEAPLRPVLSVGAGAYHFEAEGAAALPYEASTQQLWTAVFDVGAGARLAVGRHFGVSLEAHVLFTSSHPMVRIAQLEVGGAGHPSVVGSPHAGGHAMRASRAILAALALVGTNACGTAPLDVVNLPTRADGGPNPGSDATPVADRLLPPRTSGLVAHWSFDEGIGIVAHDDSGNGYHGHLVGGRWVPTGRFGGALALLPGDYVAVNGFQDATAGWTVSVWARFAPGETHGPWGAIVSTELPGEGGWMVYLEGDVPYELPRLNFDFARPNQNLVWVGCCSALQSDVWYHVTVVADAFAGSVTIYDGTSPEATTRLLSTLPPGDPTLFMGTWRPLDIDPTLGGWFSGTIDDVSIFSRALDSTEVAALDLSPPPSP